MALGQHRFPADWPAAKHLGWSPQSLVVGLGVGDAEGYPVVGAVEGDPVGIFVDDGVVGGGVAGSYVSYAKVHTSDSLETFSWSRMNVQPPTVGHHPETLIV